MNDKKITRTLHQVKLDGQKEAIREFIKKQLDNARDCLLLLNKVTLEDYGKSVSAARRYLAFADKGFEELCKLEITE